MINSFPCKVCGENVNVGDLLWREYTVRLRNFGNRNEYISEEEFEKDHPVIAAWHDKCAKKEFGRRIGSRSVQFGRCTRPGCCTPRKD